MGGWPREVAAGLGRVAAGGGWPREVAAGMGFVAAGGWWRRLEVAAGLGLVEGLTPREALLA